MLRPAMHGELVTFSNIRGGITSRSTTEAGSEYSSATTGRTVEGEAPRNIPDKAVTSSTKTLEGSEYSAKINVSASRNKTQETGEFSSNTEPGGASSVKVAKRGESINKTGKATVSTICMLSNATSDKLVDKIDSCLYRHMTEVKEEIKTIKEKMNSSKTLRHIIRNYCENEVPVNRQCASNVMLLANRCLNETERIELDMFREYNQVAIDVVCIGGGERLAVVLEGTRRLAANNSKTQNFSLMDECNRYAETTVRKLAGDDHNVVMEPGMYQYNVMKLLKECFAERGEVQLPLRTDGVSLLKEILMNMKCYNPKTKKVVFCETLDQK